MNSVEEQAERLLTVGDAARIVAVSPATIRRWLSEGHLPKVQPTGSHGVVRIDPRELRRFLGGGGDER